MLSFFLNEQILGDAPSAFRIVNITLHLLNAGLIGTITLRISKSARFATLVALLFALHPVQTLGINFLWKRSSLLEATFLLFALYLHVRERERISYRWAIIAVQFLLLVSALLTKESGVILLALLLLSDITLFRDRLAETKRSSLSLYLTLLIQTGLYLYFRLFFYEAALASHYTTLASTRTLSAIAYLRESIRALPLYLERWLLPRPLLIEDLSSSPASLGIAILLTFFVVVGSAFMLIRSRGRGMVGFFVGLFWLSLAPTLGPVAIFFPMDQIRLYLPLFGLSGLMAVAWTALSWRLAWGLALVYAVLFASQNLRYRDPALIWGDVIAAYPKSGLAWAGYGTILNDRKDYAEAARAYDQAYRFEPTESYAAKALEAEFYAGNRGPTLSDRVSRLKSERIGIPELVSLAIIEAELGLSDRAEKHLLEATERNPGYGLAYLNLAILWHRSGRVSEALRAYTEALARLPGHPRALAGITHLRRDGR